MLTEWLAQALQTSGLKQADLARALTERLGRTFDRGAVHRMLINERKISGDELIEIADICGYPIPASSHARVHREGIEAHLADVEWRLSVVESHRNALQIITAAILRELDPGVQANVRKRLHIACVAMKQTEEPQAEDLLSELLAAVDPAHDV